jgi:hypothetical protein
MKIYLKKRFFKLFFLFLLSVIILELTFTNYHSDVIEIKPTNVVRKIEYLLNISRPKYDINCNLLFEANSDEIEKAHKILAIQRNKSKVAVPGSGVTAIEVISDQNFIFNSSMCSSYKSLFNKINVTQDEKDFPLAYAIITYRHAEQIHRLLNILYRPQNFYCIHVDNKSSIEYREAINSIAACLGNVVVAHKSESMKWNGDSILQANLNCLEDLYKMSSKWKYLLTMTGDEFPLKTNYELIRILNVYNGTNEVEITNAFHDRYQMKGPPPHNYTIRKGSISAVLNREFVGHVLTSKNVQDLIKWSKGMHLPDEMYI